MLDFGDLTGTGMSPPLGYGYKHVTYHNKAYNYPVIALKIPLLLSRAVQFNKYCLLVLSLRAKESSFHSFHDQYLWGYKPGITQENLTPEVEKLRKSITIRGRL